MPRLCALEDVLDVYERPLDSKRPVIGFDEKPCQLIGNVLVPVTPRPGQVKRVDSEYERYGSANLFGWVEPLTGKRDVWLTERRTAIDYAHALKRVSDASPKQISFLSCKITSIPTPRLLCIKPFHPRKHAV